MCEYTFIFLYPTNARQTTPLYFIYISSYAYFLIFILLNICLFVAQFVGESNIWNGLYTYV